jgi:hypothetical protein
MTHKERNYLEDALQLENLCIAKCGVYADQCQNQELKSLLFGIAKNKRYHADNIKGLLSGQSADTWRYGQQYE